MTGLTMAHGGGLIADGPTGCIARCVCGWKSAHSFDNGPAHAALIAHLENPEASDDFRTTVHAYGLGATYWRADLYKGDAYLGTCNHRHRKLRVAMRCADKLLKAARSAPKATAE